MPMFGYNCLNPACLKPFETLVFSSDLDKPQPCPQCASENTERESFPTVAPTHKINGASAANNYGLKGPRLPRARGRR